MNTHNVCFVEKIRKIGIPLHTPVFLYKSGVLGGIYFTDGTTGLISHMVKRSAAAQWYFVIFRASSLAQKHFHV